MPTVKELRKIASGLKIPGRSKMNKAALIIAISASRKRKSRKRKSKSRKHKNKSRKRTPKKKSRRGQSKKGKKSRRRHKFRLGARDEKFKKLHKPFIKKKGEQDLSYTDNDVKKIYDYLVSGLAQTDYEDRVKKYNRNPILSSIDPNILKTPTQLLIDVLKTAKDSYRSREWYTASYDERIKRGVRVPHSPKKFPTRSAPYGGRETDSIYAKDKSGVGLLVAAGTAKWGDGKGGVSNPGEGAYAYNFLPKYLLGAAPDGEGPDGRYGTPEKVLNSIRLQPVEINALLKYAERQRKIEMRFRMKKSGKVKKLDKQALDIIRKDFNLEYMKQLLKNHYPPEIIEMIINHEDKWGDTPLMDAIFNDDIELVKLLLSHGAKVNHVDKAGLTPLIVASQRGNPAMVKLLLKKKANVNHKDQHDRTALYNAVGYGHENIVKLLLDAGANPNTQALPDKISPLLFVTVRSRQTEDKQELEKYRRIITMLLKHGANIKARDNKGVPVYVYFQYPPDVINASPHMYQDQDGSRFEYFKRRGHFGKAFSHPIEIDHDY